MNTLKIQLLKLANSTFSLLPDNLGIRYNYKTYNFSRDDLIAKLNSDMKIIDLNIIEHTLFITFENNYKVEMDFDVNEYGVSHRIHDLVYSKYMDNLLSLLKVTLYSKYKAFSSETEMARSFKYRFTDELKLFVELHKNSNYKILNKDLF